MTAEALARTETQKKERYPLLRLNPFGHLKPRFWWKDSTSQIDTWLLCRRKWGFKIIDRLNRQNAFGKRGTETHLHIENWLIDGIAPPEDERHGRLARTAIKHLPLPRVAEVERKFEFISRAGICYIGAIDVQYMNPETGRPQIIDNKTTTSLKWALKPEDLQTNTQSVMYGSVAALRWEAPVVDLRWLYLVDVKSRPRAKPINGTVEIEHLLQELDRLDEVALEIAALGRTAKRAIDLQPNPAACEQYGGCPYRDDCPLSNAERLEGIMTQMSIREKLLARTNGAAAGAGAAAAPQSIQATAPASNGNVSILEKMKAQAGAAQNLKIAAPETAPVSNVPAQQAPVSSQTAAPQSGADILSRLKARTQPAPTTDRVEAAGMAAAAAALAEETTTQTQQPASPVAFAASDINPPEQPETPIDDPDELAQSVAASAPNEPGKAAEVAAPAEEKRKRGRPAAPPVAATANRTVSDDGLVFAIAYVTSLYVGKDPHVAAECATGALRAFRTVP
jgi:hypothetical protein